MLEREGNGNGRGRQWREQKPAVERVRAVPRGPGHSVLLGCWLYWEYGKDRTADMNRREYTRDTIKHVK